MPTLIYQPTTRPENDVSLGVQLDDLALELRYLEMLRLHLFLAGEGMLRVVSKPLYPTTQLRLMHIQVVLGLEYETPLSVIRLTVSSLNSRVNFRRSMTHLWSHKN